MGITHSRSTVSLGNYSTRLKNILQNDVRSPVCDITHTSLFDIAETPFLKERFTWRYQTVEFYWDCRTKLDDGSRMCIVGFPPSSQNQILRALLSAWMQIGISWPPSSHHL